MILIHVVLVLFFDDDDPWQMVIVGAVADDCWLELRLLLLGMSHGNFFDEVSKDLIGGRYCIGEGVRLLLLLLFFGDFNPCVAVLLLR